MSSKNEPEEGMGLEYLNDLTFYNEHFVYHNTAYPYEKIINIRYSATATKHSVNLVPAGTTYETDLWLFLKDANPVTIRQESSFFGRHKKERAEAVMRAASMFHQITFPQRLELYESQLRDRGFVTWGEYQITKDGDLFKKNKLLFNLKKDDVTVGLSVFSFEASKKSTGLKESLIKSWKGNEIIDISIDRDCFLYFMKHYLGIYWKNEPVRDKRNQNQKEFYESIIFLGAKVCKADGRVSKEEIITFKRYFGIDEISHPESSKIFSRAVTTSQGVTEHAQKLYTLFGGEKEPLEYIVIGLIQIAAADEIITDSERKIIEQISWSFKFSKEEISRLFLLFERFKKQAPNKSSSAFHVECLQILGLGESASHEEIKITYKELVRKHHPDVLMAQGVPLERVKDSEEILKTINSAYSWLCENYIPKKAATA